MHAATTKKRGSRSNHKQRSAYGNLDLNTDQLLIRT